MIFARTIGFGPVASSLLHWSIAALAAAATLWTWHRSKDGPTRMAVLAGATLLVSPYLRAYDLALLILPIALLLQMRTGALEKIILFAAWLVPGVLMFLSTPVQFGAIVSGALMIVLVHRTFWQRNKVPQGVP